MSRWTRIPVSLCLRGARDYVQGADIYAAVVSAMQRHAGAMPEGSLQLRMHELARSQGSILIAPSGTELPVPPAGRAEFRSRDWQGWLVETGAPILERQPYDESVIESRCLRNGPIMRVIENTPCSTIETMISACKQLHQGLHPLPGHKWIVTRLDLARVIDWPDGGMEIELLQNLGNRLTRSAVRSEGAVVGHIYFSAIRA